MEEDVFFYKIQGSQYKDYVKVLLGDTEIFHLQIRSKENYDFKEQEIRHMVDALNLIPTLIPALKSIRGIEAWITPSERHLTSKVYTALDEYNKTSLGIYNNNGQP